MRVDFLRHFETKEAAHSPFCQTLDEEKIDYRIFWGRSSLHYTRRIWLVLWGWPRLLWHAFWQALAILFTRKPADFVVSWTHLEILPLILLKKLFWRKNPRIVLVGFIYTQRKSGMLRWIRRRYFHWILKNVYCAIVHSRIEALDYRQYFAFWERKFVFMPFGTHVNIISPPEVAVPYIFSAGRSGRDYKTLLAAMEGLPYPLRIVCDILHEPHDPEQVTILNHCYGGDYLRELTGATLVVIPLAADHISAGQMVMIESMALGKPVIITRTETTVEYATHDLNAWMVSMGDVEQLREAITRFMENAAERDRIGEAGRVTFHERYSMEASARQLCQLLYDIQAGKPLPL